MPTDLPAPSTAFTPVTAQGRDGTPTASDFIGDAAAHTGFFAFDPFDVQLAACERTDRDDRRRGARLLRRPRATACTSARCPRASSRRGAGDRLRAGVAGARRSTARSTVRGSWWPDPIGVGDNPRQRHPAGRPRHGRLRPDRDAPAASGRRPPATRRTSAACSTSTYRLTDAEHTDAGQARRRQRHPGDAAARAS